MRRFTSPLAHLEWFIWAILEQNIQNIVGNAIKHHRHGEVPRMHISAERIENNWQFVVQDKRLVAVSSTLVEGSGLRSTLNPHSFRRQYPTPGLGMRSFLQTFAKATSDSPYSCATFRSGVAQICS